ncbi:hypothetical protein [Gloeobacter kilaueensis]|uniref:Uncharacterized protein n=1 Tax=Gloeobacter kilaueensis (strain ATCC BAA-2537 / CCAP 1431/1 / ULC 316 / JS1) TaxID=1183438 RepID=U5QCV6_GLOK1|nr:hypothetical protein [Gloeobacter kilaueensis]AGY56752.1 hypothetical protein GKIL_0506 [Gloeobacter kilaueensis JS1]
MEPEVTRRRWTVNIAGYDKPPQIAVGLEPTRLDVDPARRGLTVYEYDWQRMIKLSASEALELLNFLRESEGALAEMAREDAAALLEAQRQLAERAWQAEPAEAFYLEQ